MIQGKSKPNWYHTPSKRHCKSQEEYDLVSRAWEKKYTEYYKVKQAFIEITKRIVAKREKMTTISNEIQRLLTENKQREKDRKKYCKSKNNDLINQLTAAQTEKKKIDLKINVIKKALVNFDAEASKEFTKKFPSKNGPILAKLRKEYEKVRQS